MQFERHVMAAPLTKLANDLEQSFFRIERANSWQAAAVNGMLAGAAVPLVAWLITKWKRVIYCYSLA